MYYDENELNNFFGEANENSAKRFTEIWRSWSRKWKYLPNWRKVTLKDTLSPSYFTSTENENWYI